MLYRFSRPILPTSYSRSHRWPRASISTATSLPFWPTSHDWASGDASHSGREVVHVRAEAARALRVRHGEIQPLEIRVQRSYRNSRWIKSLNNHLKEVAAGPLRPSHAESLWNAYTNAKPHVPGLLQAIPDRAWDLLWKSQTNLESMGKDYLRRQKQILHDMESVGRSSMLSHRLAHLETMFHQGDYAGALSQWELGFDNASGRTLDGHKPEYLDLGIRLYSVAGNPERAAQIADELYARFPTWNVNTLLNLIRALAVSPEADDHKQLLKLYMHIRGHAQDFTIEDQSTCLIAFAETNQIDNAAIVLQDMARIGRFPKQPSKDLALHVLSLLRLMFVSSSTAQEVNKVGLAALSALSVPYHPALFIYWVRRLSVSEDPTSASQAVELMFERGLQPSARHFNHLISSLFRMDEDSCHTQAESLAWRMIEAAGAQNVNAAAQTTNPYRLPFFSRRKVPDATSRTLSLLLNFYVNKKRWYDAETVRNVIGNLNYTPVTSLMNSLMYADSVQGRFQQVYQCYQNLTRGDDVPELTMANITTFKRLWKGLSVSLYDTSEQATGRFGPRGIPTPRNLMAEMMDWHRRSNTQPLPSYIVSESRQKKLAEPIMTSFRLTRDLPGALVSMHVLRTHFGLYPTPSMAQSIKGQLAWLRLPNSTSELRLVYHRSGAFQTHLGRIEAIHRIIIEKRTAQMVADNQFPETLSTKQRGEMELNILSELIRVVMVRQNSKADVETSIERAKVEMGVPDLETGDLKSYDVM